MISAAPIILAFLLGIAAPATAHDRQSNKERGMLSLAKSPADDPSICWNAKALKARHDPRLNCWCRLKKEFHSGPPGTAEWSIVPERTARNRRGED